MATKVLIKRKYRVLVKKIIAVLLALFVLFLVGVLFNAWKTNSVILKQEIAQQEKIAGHDQRIKVLNERLVDLETERGQENELIRTLPVQKPGERVVILVEEEEKDLEGLRTTEEKKGFSWWPF